jgi:hypothetical protein
MLISCGGVFASNIVKNSNFENGNYNGWSCYGDGTSCSLDLSVNPNPVYAGVYSVLGQNGLNGVGYYYINYSTGINNFAGLTCSGTNNLDCLVNGVTLDSFSLYLRGVRGVASEKCYFKTYNILNNSYTTDSAYSLGDWVKFNRTFNDTEKGIIKRFIFYCQSAYSSYTAGIYLDNVIIDLGGVECVDSNDCDNISYCEKVSNTCKAKIANFGSCGLAVECLTANECNISCLSGYANYGVCSEFGDVNSLRISSIINQCNNDSNLNHTWISNLMQATQVTSVNGIITNATGGNVTINQASGATIWGLFSRAGIGAAVGGVVGGVTGATVGAGAGCVIGAVATIWTDGGAAAGCAVGAVAGGIILGGAGTAGGGAGGALVGAGSYVYDAYNPSGISSVSMNGYTGTNLSVNVTTTIESINDVEVNCGWHKIVKINSNVNSSQYVPVRLNFDKFYYGFARVETLSGDELIGYATDSMNQSMVYYNNSIKASVIQICGGAVTETNASFDMKNYNPINLTGYYKGLLMLVNYPYNVSCNNFLYLQWSLYDNETLASQNTTNKWNETNFTLSVNNSWNYNDGYIYRGVKLSNGNNLFTNLNNYTSNNDYNVSAGNYNYYHVYGSNNDSIIGEYWVNNIDDNILMVNYIFRQETLNLTAGYFNYSMFLNTSITDDNLFQQAYFNVSGNVIKVLMNVPFTVVNYSGVTQFQLNNSYVNRRLSILIMDDVKNSSSYPITEITAAGDILTNEIGVTNPLITPVLRENQTVTYDSIIYNGSNTYIVNNYYVIDNNTRGYSTTNLSSGFIFMFPQATPAAAGTSNMLYLILVAALAVVLIYVFTNLKGGGKTSGRRRRK